MIEAAAYSNENVQTLLNKAYFYLKFRLRSEKELRTFLEKKAKKLLFQNADIEEAMRILKEEKYIDDRQFISWFVEQRSDGKIKGIRLLRSELRRFGLDRDLINDYFDNANLDEESLALRLLQKKWHKYKELEKRKRFEKAAAFLMRKGFSFDETKEVIEKLEQGDS